MSVHRQLRSLDSSNLRGTIADVQTHIQEADYELGYIFVNLSLNARNYLNTLAFLCCLQNRIKRDQEKQQKDELLQTQVREQFFEDFRMRMGDEKKMRMGCLNDEEMENHDDYKSNYFGIKLLSIIYTEAKNNL